MGNEYGFQMFPEVLLAVFNLLVFGQGLWGLNFSIGSSTNRTTLPGGADGKFLKNYQRKPHDLRRK